MTKLFAFLSYSGKDIEIAKKIAKELGNQKIFFAEWVLESGYLPNQLARGIFESKWFIIVLSEHALKTRWVEYEINLAIVRFVEEENFKIMAVKIDDCPTPLELKPFVYISEPGNPDQAIKKIIELMLHEPSSLAEKEASSFSILNRYSEIGAIEKASLQGTKIIFLWGIYGIGKSTLANHAIAKIFNRTATIFKLTKGHDEFRLAQEMATRAKLKIPSQSSTKAECIAICVDSYNELIRQGTMVFFDDIDSAIDESNSLNGYLNEILFKISSGEGKVPIFIAASRYPQFDEKLLSSLQILKVGALDEEYILGFWKNG